ncbi:MAG: hypothetical protein ACLFR7_01890 [Opitutales bacterium]
MPSTARSLRREPGPGHLKLLQKAGPVSLPEQGDLAERDRDALDFEFAGQRFEEGFRIDLLVDE